jgi:hypothetical protein
MAFAWLMKGAHPLKTTMRVVPEMLKDLNPARKFS